LTTETPPALKTCTPFATVVSSLSSVDALTFATSNKFGHSLLVTMCFGGREDVEAKKSREIDALIHRDEKVLQRQVKLLLLGE
jgi:hypothetical protein